MLWGELKHQLLQMLDVGPALPARSRGASRRHPWQQELTTRAELDGAGMTQIGALEEFDREPNIRQMTAVVRSPPADVHLHRILPFGERNATILTHNRFEN
jgi:hypothetical protein